MKIKIGLLLVLCAPCMHGMEQENKWSIRAYGTNINLNKGDILDYYADEKKEKAIVCVGQYKQEQLGETPLGGLSVGECYAGFKSVVFTPKENSINYQKARSNRWRLSSREGIVFMCVTEPRPYNYYDAGWEYWPSGAKCYEGDVAVEESCKDLLLCYNNALCYKNTLHKGKKRISEDIKNIAFPMLGANFREYNDGSKEGIDKDKAVPIAVKAILEFLTKNSGVYDNIELFMEKDSDFNLYKELLMQWNGKKNILLLYFAQKDSTNIFSLLLRDIIHYIAGML